MDPLPTASFTMKPAKFAFGLVAMALGVLATLILVWCRAEQVFSFIDPRHVVTSGFEEESLFAMWKFLNGEPIYQSPHSIPFAASYFNWLFYQIYGSVISFVTTTFHLTNDWIPTIGRGFTLLVVTLGCYVSYRLFTITRRPLPRLFAPFALCLSIILWFGPLPGYWVMTVRPDLLGLLFDTSAALWFLAYFPRRPVLAVLLAALGCYLSWSCKQINVAMPIAIGIFLLSQQKWRYFLLFSVVLSSAYALTLLLASDVMRQMLFLKNTAMPLSLEVWLGNFILFLKKTLFVWPLLAVVFIFTKHKVLDPLIRLGVCGLVGWGMILLPASSKVGSADNYHFIASLFLLCIIAGGFASLFEAREPKIVRWRERGMILSGVCLIALIAAAFANGSIAALHQQHEDHLSLKNCIAQLPQPVLVLNHYATLPWMNPTIAPTIAPTINPTINQSRNTFMLAYNYWSDRQAGRIFEQNGVGGLVQQGYFNALILTPEYATSPVFDGGSLSSYQYRPGLCQGFAIFVKENIG
ncbi:MAG: hypothetical protein ACHQJ6_08215 [Candidatus Berkiellales bacterium]